MNCEEYILKEYLKSKDIIKILPDNVDVQEFYTYIDGNSVYDFPEAAKEVMQDLANTLVGYDNSHISIYAYSPFDDQLEVHTSRLAKKYYKNSPNDLAELEALRDKINEFLGENNANNSR